MLKSAMEYLLNLKRPEVVEVDGQKFATVDLQRIKEQSNVATLEINTLTGLVDYIKSKFDRNSKLMIHVKSPTEVYLFDSLDSTNDRRHYLKAKALLPQITFERFMDRERFQIMMQANFVNNLDKETVLQIVSNIVEDTGAEIKDNGLSQQVTVKKGVASIGYEMIPGRVTLKPFRTFAEVPQPESEFILRLKEGAQVALFEADGGAWELNAIHSIKDYLASELAKEIETGELFIIG
ncbi:hypothetical protein [Lysinibacillus halotolerans]|uniref:Uncharacterized protein n=1 Tax=Lysinibacillus halotolerans TaxID=1368476 RepID=A0A3M8HDW6_9BACI|nr:hypothetical protein [Lysinibacillus halotolerans]RND00241.1 hypothetical protein EC501_05565 [Lysinibacillus halotolerans]